MLIHLIFDILAASSSLTITYCVFKWRLKDPASVVESAGMGYVLALVLGAGLGGYGFGTLNLWVSGEKAWARSIVGALAGAITAIEIFKWRHNIKLSTGIIFVPAFATTVAIGRWGCFFSGLEDKTFGIPTTLPWGWDFGDHFIPHPKPPIISALQIVHP